MKQVLKEALNRAAALARQRPELKAEIEDLAELLMAEIAEGESVRNEIDHFDASLRDLQDGLL